MFESRGLRQRGDERGPSSALCAKRLPADSSETVITAAPLSRVFDPSPVDPLAILELVEQGIERRHVERQQPARFARDLAGDVIAVELAVFERGENEDFGAALARRGPDDRISHMWQSYISSRFKGSRSSTVQGFTRFKEFSVQGSNSFRTLELVKLGEPLTP